MSAPIPPKEAWQDLASDAQIPSLEQVRTKAARFDRRIRIRNGIEYGAGVIVFVVFLAYVIFLPGFWVKVASVLIIIGLCISMWQFHRRASLLRAPDDAPASALLKHHRRSLARQRDALRSIFWWYLLPYIPGLLLFLAAIKPPPGREWAVLVVAAFILLVLLSIWYANQRGAAKLQRQIDELDSMGGAGE